MIATLEKQELYLIVIATTTSLLLKKCEKKHPQTDYITILAAFFLTQQFSKQMSQSHKRHRGQPGRDREQFLSQLVQEYNVTEDIGK